eukprot:scaffold2.g6838.t1
MANNTLSNYQYVIDEVTAKVKPEFVNEGIDESVLEELRALWEAKLVQTGVLGSADAAATTQIIAGGVQARPLAPFQTSALMAVPGMLPQRLVGAVPGMPLAGLPVQGQPGGLQPLPFQLLVAQQQQAQHAQAAAAAAQAQQVQAAAAAAVDRKRPLEEVSEPPAKQQQRGAAQTIPQQDGPADDGGGTSGEGGDGAAGGEASSEGEELNEADDLAGVDDEEVDEDAVANVVLGQFEKVQRSKARWKVVLKDCVATIEGRDYLLRRTTGEMMF